eukprot:20459_6
MIFESSSLSSQNNDSSSNPVMSTTITQSMSHLKIGSSKTRFWLILDGTNEDITVSMKSFSICTSSIVFVILTRSSLS